MLLRNLSPSTFPFVNVIRRGYHDESFGFRPLPRLTLPDYTPEQLQNRAYNAPLLRYLDSIRTHAHRAASIDPLDLIPRLPIHNALDPERYGLTQENATYDINGIMWCGQRCADTNRTLKDITEHMKSIYVGRIAYEYMHSPSKSERLWWSHYLESGAAERTSLTASPSSRLMILNLLSQSEVFDNFLQLKFPNLKRYGLEGGESMLPALDSLFRTAAQSGVQNIVLAMPHRGRLNLLTNLLQFEPRRMFHKIKGGPEFAFPAGGQGDVLSHLYASPMLEYDSGSLQVSLLPNPSHLEAVDPVALGLTRAKQFSLLKSSPQDCQLGDKVMCVQIHGDASFTGQGVVMECLGMSNLPHYTCGGTIHLVVDNNIGYTTPASTARSSAYCSDIGKMINAPVLHVNGDHPEDVVRAMEIAFQYRNHFRKDIIIDLLVYRRWGHNELDLPDLTSPRMYEKIRSRKTVPILYEEKLQRDGMTTEEHILAIRKKHKAYLEQELVEAESYQPPPAIHIGNSQDWKPMVGMNPDSRTKWDWNPDTGVPVDLLVEIGKASVKFPEGFTIHSKLQRHVKNRLKSLEEGKGVDWATAEALATGSLLLEGYDVRFSGQDVGRGTFSQRHGMLVDQITEAVYVPVNENLMARSANQEKGMLELANSSLSEMAILGFEYGTSWERPTLLPIWEAQFGDFFNGAQIIIDTFIASGEAKWVQQSGLVLLLPHGLDGAGPEHSSCRIERFLQLTDDAFEPGIGYTSPNMHVVYPTTAAQYFHLLRRQMERNFRKPLIVAAPKGLLRLGAASSSLQDMKTGTRFTPVLDDFGQAGNTDSVKRVVLMSGKLFYDLAKEREIRQLEQSIALIRVEELCPFPFEDLTFALSRYPNKAQIVWVQEEPRNQGAWPHVKERMEACLGGRRVVFVGRQESAIPAPGVNRCYTEQQRGIIEGALGVRKL